MDFKFFDENKTVIMSIIAILGAIVTFLKTTFAKKAQPAAVNALTAGTNSQLVPTNSNVINITNTQNHGTGSLNKEQKNSEVEMPPNFTLEELKSKTHILFIDDDIKFKVVTILRKADWLHTKAIKDIQSLDCPEVLEAQILFVDIKGVGIALDFKDQGLGLALVLKKKYPAKKIIIYSAETSGERFHPAFHKCDGQLAKNAEPYEFQELVEELSLEIQRNK